MDQKDINIEARLYALELFAANQLAISAMTSGLDPQKLIETVRNQMSEGAKKLTFPDLDPAMSDVIASEIEQAVLLLVEMASAQIAHVLKGGAKT
jgi:hypothetical protein